MLTAIILIPLEFLQFVFRLFCQQLLFFPQGNLISISGRICVVSRVAKSEKGVGEGVAAAIGCGAGAIRFHSFEGE